MHFWLEYTYASKIIVLKHSSNSVSFALKIKLHHVIVNMTLKRFVGLKNMPWSAARPGKSGTRKASLEVAPATRSLLLMLVVASLVG